jgi:hypothetical protein
MSGFELVSMTYAGVFLILGLVALLRARQADIPAVVHALAWWFRRDSSCKPHLSAVDTGSASASTGVADGGRHTENSTGTERRQG